MARGLSTPENTSNDNYATIVNGNFAIRVGDPTKTSVSRKLTKGVNEGKLVHEELDSQLEGFIVSFKVRESADKKYKSWLIKLDITHEGPDEFLTVQLPYDSSYSADIIKRIEGLELTKTDTILRVYDFIPKGEDKAKIGVSLLQGKTKIENNYKRDSKLQLPEWIKVDLGGGKTAWNKEEYLLALEAIVTKCFPKDRSDASNTSETTTPTQESKETVTGVKEETDNVFKKKNEQEAADIQEKVIAETGENDLPF